MRGGCGWRSTAVEGREREVYGYSGVLGWRGGTLRK